MLIKRWFCGCFILILFSLKPNLKSYFYDKIPNHNIKS
ncbi:hypothetical protein HPHPA14_0875 [Helicobacter pylori Hp A-14]|nr:hypothetical protein HPHPA14_0875 [Helicobacter pylori Hp A-14]